MLKNYLTTALRTLARHKGYSLLNVIGLAIGVACCLLILLFVRSEWTVDRFHTNADRIVRVYSETTLGPEPSYGPYTASILAPTLEERFPDVEATARLQPLGTPRMQRQDQADYVEHIYAADPSVLSIFDIPLLEGDAATALTEPNTILLTPALAQTFFGETDPIGQAIQLEYRGTSFHLTVTGLLGPLPGGSHLDIEVLVPFSVYGTVQGERGLASWFNQNPSTYVLLREGADWQQFSASLGQTINNIVERDAAGREIWFTYFAQPLTDIHLGRLGLLIEPEGNLQNLTIFSVVALLILLIACINYVNLATARAGKRAREVGVRKAIGARKEQLAGQFLLEALLLSLGAFVLALGLVYAVLPRMEALTGTVLVLGDGAALLLIGGLFGLSVVTGLLAGMYPALVLADFQPIRVLRGSWQRGRQGGWLRKGLVVGQFACGIALIIGTLAIFAQLRYTQQKSLGFDQEQVVVVPLRTPALQGRPGVVKSEIARVPGVVGVSVATQPPGGWTSGNGVTFPGQTEGEGTIRQVVAVDAQYADVLDLEIAQGRWFDPDLPTDSVAYVINEAALRLIENVPALGGELDRNGAKGPIIGVVEDFHFESLHKEIEPLVLYMRGETWEAGVLLVKLAPGRIPETLAGLQAAWADFAGEEPFTYSFLQDDLNQLYSAEQRLANLFGLFAGLGIFVACLGLFGLAAYAAEQRTKEVGVRKVLGASVPSLIVLLIRDFIGLVLIALVLAAPPAYLLMQRWLEDFAYRITLGPSVFLLAGGLALLIALATVSTQALRAASADPIKSLRYE